MGTIRPINQILSPQIIKNDKTMGFQEADLSQARSNNNDLDSTMLAKVIVFQLRSYFPFDLFR